MTDPIKWRPIKRSVLIAGGPRRLPVAVAAVAAILIAAMALVGRGESSAQPPAADSKNSAGTAHSRQGARSAAAKAAAAFGGEAMYSDQGRRDVIERLFVPDKRTQMLTDMGDQYRQLARRIGLDSHGKPPAGATFVSRTVPAGTTVHAYSDTTATVSVWCSTVFGLTGRGVKEIPTTDGWITMSVSLQWADTEGWLVTDMTQRDGPQPGDAGADAGQAPDL
ncbi:hypothetical protein [Streptomyces sp. NBC_00847]|uniref:hypothetical protein n=1 Tax=Streptomyces sp. NBC_00847 TaxID=2975850 RepID=UPI00225E267F|nr:hypothetical protein [Streptomyces sp. NBC_00847]MCX4885986.1 hypothetical protein [Streptomyces sp. NBC_00847]